jgi:hypothetical protein
LTAIRRFGALGGTWFKEKGKHMGMTASYQRISASDLEKFLEDPEFASSFTGLTADDPYEFFQALETSGKRLDIQKEWQSLHFLLTGEVADPGQSEAPLPLCNVVMGGTETECEATYGVVRYLDSSEVNEVAVALGRITDKTLATCFDPAKFEAADLYAGGQWDDETFGYLLDVFHQVAAFFKAAALAGDAMLLSLD